MVNVKGSPDEPRPVSFKRARAFGRRQQPFIPLELKIHVALHGCAECIRLLKKFEAEQDLYGPDGSDLR